VGLVLLGHVGNLSLVGLLSLTLVAATLGAAIFANGPSLAVLRHRVHKGPDRTDAYRTAMLRLGGLGALGGVITGLVLCLWRTSIGEPVAFASVLTIAEALFIFESTRLRADGRFVRLSVFATVRMLVAWGAAVAAASSSSFLWVAAAYVAAIYLVGLVMEHPRLSSVDSQTRADLRSSWRKISSYSLATYALNNGDQYLLAIIAGPAAVGVYALGYTLGGGVISLVTDPVAGVLGPRIFREWEGGPGGHELARSTARRAALVFITAGVVLTVLLYAAGKVGLLSFVSSAEALPAVAAIVAFAVAVHAATTILYQSILYLRGRSNLLSRSAWITLVPAIGVIVALSIPFKETGTAVATLFAYVLMGTLQWYYARRGRDPDAEPAVEGETG